MDKLSEREGLDRAIVIALVTKISNAARRKLAERYDIAGVTNPIAKEAEDAALLQVIRETPEPELWRCAESLAEGNRLTAPFLLAALDDGQMAFFESALAHLSELRLEVVKGVTRHEGLGPVFRLLKRAKIPSDQHDAFWMRIEKHRRPLH